MTALDRTPCISIASGANKSHVDNKKGLARRFAATFPFPLFSSKGAWQIDALAEHAPWRVTVDSDQAITFSRLAVHRAWEAATTVIGQKRGRFEVRAILQKGYLDERGDIIRSLRLAASKPQRPLNALEKTALFWAGLLVERLGLRSPPAIAENGTCAELAAWLETIDSAVSSGPGRPSTFDVNSFFQSDPKRLVRRRRDLGDGRGFRPSLQIAAKFRVCRACDYRGSDHYSR